MFGDILSNVTNSEHFRHTGNESLSSVHSLLFHLLSFSPNSSHSLLFLSLTLSLCFFLFPYDIVTSKITVTRK